MIVRAFARAGCALVLIALSGSIVRAQESVSIPLRGTLAVKCSVQTHDLRVDTNEGLATITIMVQHECNASSNLIVAINPGTGLAEPQFTATYNRRPPTMKTADRAIFFESQPVEAVREVRLEMTGAGTEQIEDVVASLMISVEPL